MYRPPFGKPFRRTTHRNNASLAKETAINTRFQRDMVGTRYRDDRPDWLREDARVDRVPHSPSRVGEWRFEWKPDESAISTMTSLNQRTFGHYASVGAVSKRVVDVRHHGKSLTIGTLLTPRNPIPNTVKGLMSTGIHPMYAQPCIHIGAGPYGWQEQHVGDAPPPPKGQHQHALLGGKRDRPTSAASATSTDEIDILRAAPPGGRVALRPLTASSSCSSFSLLNPKHLVAAPSHAARETMVLSAQASRPPSVDGSGGMGVRGGSRPLTAASVDMSALEMKIAAASSVPKWPASSAAVQSSGQEGGKEGVAAVGKSGGRLGKTIRKGSASGEASPSPHNPLRFALECLYSCNESC